MLRTSLFLLLGIFLCTSARAQERNQLLIDSLHEEMTLLAATDQVPGFAVALVTADGPVYERGFGYADLATKRPYTPQTTQNIGSISKTFIGVSLLQAEQEGLLSLEDPINQYLPFQVTHPRYPNQPILLKHLANHTAGISDDKNYDYAYTLLEPATIARGEVSKGEYKEFRAVQQNEPYTLEAFLHRFFTPGGRFYHKKNFTKAAPGAVYKYSNVGAALAAYVLERATKTPFPEWTEQHLFQPLKMTNTAWRPDQVNDRMTHYFANRKPMPNYLLATYPDGGLWTSIHQLGLWCSAAIGGMEKGNDILSEYFLGADGLGLPWPLWWRSWNYHLNVHQRREWLWSPGLRQWDS